MPSRHRSRQRALQILYQLDLNQQQVYNAIDNFYESLYTSESEEEAPKTPDRDPFMEILVKGSIDNHKAIDDQITRHSEHWRLERMNVMDRLILRLATYEFLHEADTPGKVIINEALELARTFSGDDAVRFINGILDAIRKKLERE